MLINVGPVVHITCTRNELGCCVLQPPGARGAKQGIEAGACIGKSDLQGAAPPRINCALFGQRQGMRFLRL